MTLLWGFSTHTYKHKHTLGSAKMQLQRSKFGDISHFQCLSSNENGYAWTARLRCHFELLQLKGAHLHSQYQYSVIIARLLHEDDECIFTLTELRLLDNNEYDYMDRGN
jgi:hypothetical protein